MSKHFWVFLWPLESPVHSAVFPPRENTEQEVDDIFDEGFLRGRRVSFSATIPMRDATSLRTSLLAGPPPPHTPFCVSLLLLWSLASWTVAMAPWSTALSPRSLWSPTVKPPSTYFYFRPSLSIWTQSRGLPLRAQASRLMVWCTFPSMLFFALPLNVPPVAKKLHMMTWRQ